MGMALHEVITKEGALFDLRGIEVDAQLLHQFLGIGMLQDAHQLLGIAPKLRGHGAALLSGLLFNLAHDVAERDVGRHLISGHLYCPIMLLSMSL
jgi:hypothetical protein